MKTRFSIAVTEKGVKELRLEGEDSSVFSRQRDKGLRARQWEKIAGKELRAYFSGKLSSFSTPCDLGGLTPFTQAVLKVTARIPYGEVRSYRWVAEQLGRPKASRAVGNALARNPIPIMIPCHRVIRSGGGLGGYALGLGWKRRLLGLEKGRLWNLGRF